MFLYILTGEYKILKIRVPTPHNTSLIIEGRHENFHDALLWSQDIAQTEYKRDCNLLGHPLYGELELLANYVWYVAPFHKLENIN